MISPKKRKLGPALQALVPTGPFGFEGLVKALLERLTGYRFHLASSGSQAGRDMACDRRSPTVLAVECKRYGDGTELRQTELLGKLLEAHIAIPDLDVWLLVASRPVSDQLHSALEEARTRSNLDVDVAA